MTLNKVSLHYNANCPDCVRQARRIVLLDWLRAINVRTDPSPLGDVPPGEIVVVKERKRRVYTGVYAIRMVCVRIPLLLPYRLLPYLPLVRDRVGKSKPGCNSDACEV